MRRRPNRSSKYPPISPNRPAVIAGTYSSTPTQVLNVARGTPRLRRAGLTVTGMTRISKLSNTNPRPTTEHRSQSRLENRVGAVGADRAAAVAVPIDSCDDALEQVWKSFNAVEGF